MSYQEGENWQFQLSYLLQLFVSSSPPYLIAINWCIYPLKNVENKEKIEEEIPRILVRIKANIFDYPICYGALCPKVHHVWLPSIGAYYHLKKVEEQEEVSRIVVRIETDIFDYPIYYGGLYPSVYEVWLPSMGDF